MDDHGARAASFGGVAAEYERGRPTYPRDAVAWLVGAEPIRVVDLGAGTGKLTRALLELGHDVIAVEPADGMRAELVRAFPTASALDGTAEAIPLPDAHADAVVAGQAFHWFDADAALPEIARVLRRDGVLGLVWNKRDEGEPWVHLLAGIVGSERLEQYELDAVIAASGLFDDLERARFRFEQPLDRAALRDLVQSMSRFAVRPPGERVRLLDRIDRLYDEAAGPDGLVLPYETWTFRTTRPLAGAR